jgi:hypothetical protein
VIEGFYSVIEAFYGVMELSSSVVEPVGCPLGRVHRL